MTVNGTTLPQMSEQHATDKRHMAGLLDEDVEGWARLSGLLAMLALPPVRLADGTHRLRIVEIEVRPDSDKWIAIDGVTLEPHRLLCWRGGNGSRVVYEYPRGSAIPKWRTPCEITPPSFMGSP